MPLFLHGAGDQAGAWAQVAPFLAKDYKVVLLDLPGHGGSAPEKGPLPLPTLFEGVHAALTSLCDEGSVVIGNSLGAWLACLLAKDAPAKVGALVLVNGGPIRGHYLKPILAPKDRPETREVMRVLMGRAAAGIPGFVLDDIVRAGREGAIPRLLLALDSFRRFCLAGRGASGGFSSRAPTLGGGR